MQRRWLCDCDEKVEQTLRLCKMRQMFDFLTLRSGTVGGLWAERGESATCETIGGTKGRLARPTRGGEVLEETWKKAWVRGA